MPVWRGSWRTRKLAPRLAELSAEQERQLSIVRDEWRDIALATGPGDRETAERAAADIYRLLGRPEPCPLLWVKSPQALSQAISAASESAAGRLLAQNTVSGEAARVCGAWAKSHAWNERGNKLDHVLNGLIRKIISDTDRRVTPELWQRIQHGPFDALFRPLRAIWQKEFARPAGWTWPGLDRLACYDFLRRAADFSECELLLPFMTLARNAGGLCLYENLGVLIERPSQLRRDGVGRLHADDGPAVVYPDGWALYFWRGTRVASWFIEHRERITLEAIRLEGNQEIRRAMLEIFGFERFVQEGGAERVHEDACGILWRLPLIDEGEPHMLVEVVNGTPEPDGTHRRYFLRVPPTMHTATEAVAWTYGLDTRHYRLSGRT